MNAVRTLMIVTNIVALQWVKEGELGVLNVEFVLASAHGTIIRTTTINFSFTR